LLLSIDKYGGTAMHWADSNGKTEFLEKIWANANYTYSSNRGDKK
jgi:ankyrin repeat protein